MNYFEKQLDDIEAVVKFIEQVQNNEKMRGWIKTAITSITKSLRGMWAINAAVGSGKTRIAELLIKIEMLRANAKNKQSIHFFVAPRIKLCAQQAGVFLDNISFDNENIKVKVIQVDCLHNDFNKNDLDRQLISDKNMHFVFVICDKSLWGNEKNFPFNKWIESLNGWKNRRGFELGVIAYDEAHNYNSNFNKICGDANVYLSLGNDPAETTLDSLFKYSLLMSGTPSEFQCNIVNRIDFSLYDSIKTGCVLKPHLYSIFGLGRKHLINAIKSCYENELDLRTRLNEQVKIIFNCSGIDEIKCIMDHDFIKKGIANKEFHVISMHSDKDVYVNGEEITITSAIDGVTKHSNDVYNLINKMDDENIFNDNKPILLFQVDMISEGLNLNSFSAAFITTNNGLTFVQQMGRVIRLHKNKKQANIYVMLDVEHSASMLIQNLAKTQLLTSDCFDWTHFVKPKTGSSNKPDTSNLAKLNFAKIMDLTIAEIKTAFSESQNKYLKELNENIEIEWLKLDIEDINRNHNWGNAETNNKFLGLLKKGWDWKFDRITEETDLKNFYADLVNFRTEMKFDH